MMPAQSVSSAAHFLCVDVTLVLENLVHLLVKVNRHAHFPWSRENLRIFDGHFVRDRIGCGPRESFRGFKSVAMEISGVVKPRLIVETDGFDNKRVALPMSARISHP